jgi:flavodoxin short chain
MAGFAGLLKKNFIPPVLKCLMGSAFRFEVRLNRSLIYTEEEMSKALIIFGSTTGNTENMAGIVSNALESSGIETELKEVTEAAVADLTADQDLFLLGCPAYGDDTIELQEDFEEFYEQLDEVNLNGKPFAVFAPGDSTYEYFCGSVDMLEEKMNALGGEQLVEGLKIDGDPDDEEDEIEAWAKSVAAAMK